MLSWKWAGIPALFFIAACGNAPRLTWPAAVASIEISDAGKSIVASDIENLNKEIGSTILRLEGSNGSPIHIKSVSSFGVSNSVIPQGAQVHLDYVSLGAKGNSRAAAPTTQIAGRATLDSNQCVIELGSFLFEDNARDLLMPVLWHEIGHCGGLVHLSEANEVMSPITNRVQTYSKEQFKRFFDALLASIR
jgi:hypothetical protein